MENKLKQILEKTKLVKLNQQEKMEIRKALLNFMKIQPVRARGILRPILQERSILTKIILTLKKPMPVIAIILIIALVGGGSASVAAQQALPQDILYPIKININEKVRSALAFSPEAKAEIEVELAEKRVEEAEQLAAEGRLTKAAQAQVEQNFDRHAAKIKEKIEQFSAQGKAEKALELASNLEASLKAHEQILNQLSLKKGNENVKKLALEVKTKSEEAGDWRAEEESKIKTGVDVKAAVLGRLKAVQNKIEEVEKFIDKAKVSAEVKTMAEDKLKIAKDLKDKVEVQIEAQEYNEAFLSLAEAHRLAQEAKLTITAEQRFKIYLPSSPTSSETETETEEEKTEIKAEEETEGEGKIKGEVEIEKEAKVKGDNEGDEGIERGVKEKINIKTGP